MDLVLARGHKNVTAEHKTTTEITTEDFLTKTGDCIIGISADKSTYDLCPQIKNHLKSGGLIEIFIECGGEKDTICGSGDSSLTFEDKTSFVIRRSDFVCPRTLCIRSDKASFDLNRAMIEKIKEGRPISVKIQPKV